jgi:hypothetical protein
MNNGTGCGTCNGDNDNADADAETADGNNNDAPNGCCNGEEGDKAGDKSEGNLINYIINKKNQDILNFKFI